ncbi:MAG: dockerin type I domain-containing protein, partial [Planctomycetota bacterium]
GGENTFHNYSNPYDVNQDGYISAVDVLLIVQRLRLSNRGGESGSQLDTSLKTDVNDDGNTSAIDAAMLLRELNTLSRGGELAGESIATPSADNGERVLSDESTIGTNDSDSVFAGIGASGNTNSNAAAYAANAGLDSVDEDEDDDTLSLLAENLLS